MYLYIQQHVPGIYVRFSRTMRHSDCHSLVIRKTLNNEMQVDITLDAWDTVITIEKDHPRWEKSLEHLDTIFAATKNKGVGKRILIDPCFDMIEELTGDSELLKPFIERGNEKLSTRRNSKPVLLNKLQYPDGKRLIAIGPGLSPFFRSELYFQWGSSEYVNEYRVQIEMQYKDRSTGKWIHHAAHRELSTSRVRDALIATFKKDKIGEELSYYKLIIHEMLEEYAIYPELFDSLSAFTENCKDKLRKTPEKKQ